MPQQTKIWSIVETRRHLLPDEHDQIGRLEQEIVVKKTELISHGDNESHFFL